MMKIYVNCPKIEMLVDAKWLTRFGNSELKRMTVRFPLKHHRSYIWKTKRTRYYEVRQLLQSGPACYYVDFYCFPVF